MKLKSFNQSNSKNQVTGQASLRINEKGGLFTLGKYASRLIGLSGKSSLEIFQDEDSIEDFFIYVSKSPEAFTLRCKTGTDSYAFNCTKLAKLILDRGIEKNHVVPLNRAESFKIGAAIEVEGMPMHLIILSKPFESK